MLYGTTHTLFAHILPSQGVSVRFAADDSAAAIAKLIDDKTRAIFCESVGNPAGNICDIQELVRVAHEHGVPLIVDNTVASPVLLRPIEHGADIVVESLTKFLGGHGTTLGGAIIDSGNFDWKRHAARFPAFSTAGCLVSRPGVHRAFRKGGVHCALPERVSAYAAER